MRIVLMVLSISLFLISCGEETLAERQEKNSTCLIEGCDNPGAGWKYRDGKVGTFYYNSKKGSGFCSKQHCIDAWF